MKIMEWRMDRRERRMDRRGRMMKMRITYFDGLIFGKRVF